LFYPFLFFGQIQITFANGKIESVLLSTSYIWDKTQETSLTKIAKELLPLNAVTSTARLLRGEEEGMVVGQEEDEEKIEEEESSISI